MTQPRLLGGRYELDGVVGRGGMAEVYRARDVRLDRIVAVKTLRVDLARDQTFQARFRREAQSAASLNHPSIAAVYDTGEDCSGNTQLPFIVMEYVDGRTIRDLVRDDRRLLPERVLEITEGVLRALDYSHRKGIVHRDIKPGNVMLNRSGEIKVMDFGIARAVSDAQATMTQTAQIIGTVSYMSPEQARGKRVDGRSDLYSTGCLLYVMLTGRPPFSGRTPLAILDQHVNEDPLPPSWVDPEVPAWGDAIALKVMAKDPADRYQSAAEMRNDIKRAISGVPVLAPLIDKVPHHAYQGSINRSLPTLMPELTSFAAGLAGTTTVSGAWEPPSVSDLEIRVPAVPSGGVPMVELRGTEGELTVPVRLPSPPTMADLLARFSQTLDMARLHPRLAEQRGEDVVRALGARLFDAILPGEARMLYQACRSASRRDHAYLRLVLRIGHPELADLPWEFMYDDQFAMYPCLDYPIVRYVEQPLSVQSLWSNQELRILGMTAAPNDLPDLEVDRERNAVESALSSLIRYQKVQLDWVRGQTWQDLQRKLYKRQYNVFHFVGHGWTGEHSREGSVIFCTRSGGSDPVPASDLAGLLSGQHLLQLAVLNCCESAGNAHWGDTSVASALVRRGVGAALAMREAISSPSALECATVFYDALGASLSIDVASVYARHAVKRRVPNSLEWGSPVLFLRSLEPVYFPTPRTVR